MTTMHEKIEGGAVVTFTEVDWMNAVDGVPKKTEMVGLWIDNATTFIETGNGPAQQGCRHRGPENPLDRDRGASTPRRNPHDEVRMTTWKRDQQTAADKEPFTGPRLKRRGEGHAFTHLHMSGGVVELGGGLTKRELFAVLLSTKYHPASPESIEYLATVAVQHADALLAELDRKPPSDDGAPEGPVFL
jgi:hypothetical protein